MKRTTHAAVLLAIVGHVLLALTEAQSPPDPPRTYVVTKIADSSDVGSQASFRNGPRINEVGSAVFAVNLDLSPAGRTVGLFVGRGGPLTLISSDLFQGGIDTYSFGINSHDDVAYNITNTVALGSTHRLFRGRGVPFGSGEVPTATLLLSDLDVVTLAEAPPWGRPDFLVHTRRFCDVLGASIDDSGRVFFGGLTCPFEGPGDGFWYIDGGGVIAVAERRNFSWTTTSPFDAFWGFTIDHTGFVVLGGIVGSQLSVFTPAGGGAFNTIVTIAPPISGLSFNRRQAGHLPFRATLTTGGTFLFLDPGHQLPPPVVPAEFPFATVSLRPYVTTDAQTPFTVQFGTVFNRGDAILTRDAVTNSTSTVISTGMPLGSSTITGLVFADMNTSGQIVFTATLADGTAGLYRADPIRGSTCPPAPGTPKVLRDVDGNGINDWFITGVGRFQSWCLDTDESNNDSDTAPRDEAYAVAFDGQLWCAACLYDGGRNLVAYGGDGLDWLNVDGDARMVDGGLVALDGFGSTAGENGDDNGNGAVDALHFMFDGQSLTIRRLLGRDSNANAQVEGSEWVEVHSATSPPFSSLGEFLVYAMQIRDGNGGGELQPLSRLAAAAEGSGALPCAVQARDTNDPALRPFLEAVPELPSDGVAPVTSALLSPSPNAAGWNNADVALDLTASDNPNGSGVREIDITLAGSQSGSVLQSGSHAHLLINAEGATTVAYLARDNAGNEEAANSLLVRLDKTPPAVAFAGQSGAYTVDQTITISCSASDALSGIVANTCAAASLAGVHAYSLGTGPHARSASATDAAGNTGTSSVSFTVAVTPGSLCLLTKQFVQGSSKYQSLPPRQRATADALADTLCSRLAAIVPKLTPGQRASLIAAYTKGVAALAAGGWLTQSQATTLTNLAAALQANTTS